MIEIKNLEASIDDKTILKGIDLEIPAGEVHVTAASIMPRPEPPAAV